MKKQDKRTTIFRQLIFSVLLPVVILISGISVYNFYDKKNQVIENREEIVEQLQTETAEFLEFYDLTIFELEKSMSADAKMFSEKLVNDVFPESEGILTANLDSIKDEIGMTNRQDIYIIDTNGVIVNTSYPPDLGLDFFSRGEFFIKHFNEVWSRQEFMEDRISIEGATRLPKKYTYQSTKDTMYVVELGMYNEAAIILVDHLIEKLNSMPEKYSDIDSVTLYFGTTYFMNYQMHPMRSNHFEQAIHTLETKESTKVIEEANGFVYTTEFHFLNMEKAHLHDGYVLRVIHNDEKIQELLWSEVKTFLLNLLLFTLPIFLLILWRAKSLSKPISELVKKIDAIQANKSMDERVPLVGNNEVTELGIHFNSMVAELQASYQTLEQKVIDRTKEVVAQKEIIEEVYHEIQDSINYAKRLQDAILPRYSDIQQAFSDYFILFRPKDVVSGDFYWFEQKGEISFIASADCTGHGVPGAMVSVVCSNALNRSVNEFNLTSPAQILGKARELVIETFARSGENVKDGMDIALCAFNKNLGKLVFSGANNPLWVVRKNEFLNSEQKENKSSFTGESMSLIEFKADKQPVGLYAGMTDFTDLEIEIKADDRYYFFTDGYADQFGGDKGKKLKYRPFKEILLDIHDVKMSMQNEKLGKMFAQWKGDFEQVDDVCIIGVQV